MVCSLVDRKQSSEGTSSLSFWGVAPYTLVDG